MSYKLTLSAVILALIPAVAASAGCSRDHEQAMSCAEGSVWSSDTKSCVPQTSS